MSQLREGEMTVTEAVSRERLMSDTEAIARWVRMSGSEDERRAFDYVEEVLRDLGLEPQRHLGKAYVSLPESASLEVQGTEIPAITHSMAPSTTDEGLKLPLVDLGKGTPSEYESQDVRDKIVLVDGMAMPGKVMAAERAGAAACIFANQDEHVHEMIVSRVWGSPTPSTKEQLPRLPVVSINRAGVEALREILRENEPAAARLVTRVWTGWTELPTLTAQLDGGQEPEKFVLFSGHIDSWHYGAMDNASANATMLETLRVLLPQREAFVRSLRLAFWSGHSHGRYAGSAWYADHFWENLYLNCVLHLNVDSTGGRNATVLTEAHAMAETRDCAAEVIEVLTGQEFTGTRFGRAGDQSFLGHGVPSLFMSLSEQPPSQGDSAGGFAELVGGEGAKSGGLGWWWHTTEDTLDKIDPDFLRRDTQVYAAVAHRFVSEPVLPLNVRASAEELLEHLRAWQEKAGSRFDLSEAVSRAETLVDLATRFQAGLETEGMISQGAAYLNEIIQRVESALVGLNYTRLDRFDHDPALSQPPVPLLEPIDRLVAAEEGSDEENEMLTLLVRRRNRIQHELSAAGRALRDGLAV